MTRRASRTLMAVLSVTTVAGVGAYAVAHRGGSATPATPNNKTVETASVAPPRTGNVTLMSVTPAPGATVTGPTVNPGPATKPILKLTPDAPKPAAPQPPKPAPIANLKSQISNPATVIADAKAKLEAGDLIPGRKLLNDALIAGQLPATDAATARQLISDANKTIVFAPRRYTDDPWGGGHPVATGENLQKIAFKYGLTPEFLLRINGMTDARKLRANTTIKILQGPFHAVVNKKAFTLDVYLGSPGEKNAQYVTTYPVGLGKDDSTPTGTWIIEQRIPNPKWWGARGLPPTEPGDPKNPLGKFWLSRTGVDGRAEGQQSYGIHGTNEPDSIGKQASMGCIRMRNEDIALVYELLVAGKSTVVVRD